jgi:hypothetical protein
MKPISSTVTDLYMLQSFIKRASKTLDDFKEYDEMIYLINTYLCNTYSADFNVIEIDKIDSFKQMLYNHLHSETYLTDDIVKISMKEISTEIIHPRLTAQYIIKKRLMTGKNIGNMKILPYDILEKIANNIE